MRALVVRKDEGTGETFAAVEDIDDGQLPDGDVTVDVEYSTVNYKDGLCLGAGGGLVRAYPHVPGIDFAGTISHTENTSFRVGDKVILTGWRVGENRWGGYAEKARVKSEWLVPVPDGLTTRHAMAVGTAGFTSMLAIMALENHGLKPGCGPVLVTGAAGGVGSISVSLLAARGYDVAVVTGRPEAADYLRDLGASQIIAREEMCEVVKRPLEGETWQGCIDAVGGAMLARILGQMKTRGSVAAVGLAGGANLSASIIPFLLRGVNLLGIDSVMQPMDTRIQAWTRIAQDISLDTLEEMIDMASLSDLPQLGSDILMGKVKGRVVIDLAR
ncbi:MAG: oxidoreductase [Aestuariivita sp.]|nr:oxidoreductase [Aestuariivita sp.]